MILSNDAIESVGAAISRPLFRPGKCFVISKNEIKSKEYDTQNYDVFGRMISAPTASQKDLRFFDTLCRCPVDTGSDCQKIVMLVQHHNK